MDEKKVFDRAYNQFALDFNCDPEVFYKGGVYVRERVSLPGRRRFIAEPPSFQLITNGSAVVVMCDDKYRDFAEDFLKDKAPEWISEFPKLSRIEEELSKFGERIADAHQFYLPLLSTPEPEHAELETEFYDEAGIEQFRGDKRFGEAYAFNERFPDVLGVSAKINGEICGMAGASRDGDGFYQIGIGTFPEARGKGVASYLTWLLKEALIERDIVPFYGTAMSHFISQNVARKAGFFPAWAELSSEPKV